jgi:hypothetical protein
MFLLITLMVLSMINLFLNIKHFRHLIHIFESISLKYKGSNSGFFRGDSDPVETAKENLEGNDKIGNLLNTLNIQNKG